VCAARSAPRGCSTACGGIRVGRFREPDVIAPAGDQLQLTTGRQEDADADRGRQELRLGGTAVAGAAIIPGAPSLVGLVLAAGPALIDPIDPGEVIVGRSSQRRERSVVVGARKPATYQLLGRRSSASLSSPWPSAAKALSTRWVGPISSSSREVTSWVRTWAESGPAGGSEVALIGVSLARAKHLATGAAAKNDQASRCRHDIVWQVRLGWLEKVQP
jgi:hypothetical protein